jgi:hypothetical protein
LIEYLNVKERIETRDIGVGFQDQDSRVNTLHLFMFTIGLYRKSFVGWMTLPFCAPFPRDLCAELSDSGADSNSKFSWVYECIFFVIWKWQVGR